MKNLGKLFLILFISLSVVSCKKEVIYPTDQLPANVPTVSSDANTVSMWGEFVITDAVMYVDNHETGSKTVFNHFSSTQLVSSLRIGGAMFEIEEIEKNVTTYAFYKPVNGTGKFVLNNDTVDVYAVRYSGMNKTIIENPTSTTQLMGGSARPFNGWTVDLANEIIVIHIQEMEGSLNGYNVHYYTELTLKKTKSW